MIVADLLGDLQDPVARFLPDRRGIRGKRATPSSAKSRSPAPRRPWSASRALASASRSRSAALARLAMLRQAWTSAGGFPAADWRGKQSGRALGLVPCGTHRGSLISASPGASSGLSDPFPLRSIESRRRRGSPSAARASRSSGWRSRRPAGSASGASPGPRSCRAPADRGDDGIADDLAERDRAIGGDRKSMAADRREQPRLVEIGMVLELVGAIGSGETRIASSSLAIMKFETPICARQARALGGAQRAPCSR